MTFFLKGRCGAFLNEDGALDGSGLLSEIGVASSCTSRLFRSGDSRHQFKVLRRRGRIPKRALAWTSIIDHGVTDRLDDALGEGIDRFPGKA